jgi:hypothetical protein
MRIWWYRLKLWLFAEYYSIEIERDFWRERYEEARED